MILLSAGTLRNSIVRNAIGSSLTFSKGKDMIQRMADLASTHPELARKDTGDLYPQYHYLAALLLASAVAPVEEDRKTISEIFGKRLRYELSKIEAGICR